MINQNSLEKCLSVSILGYQKTTYDFRVQICLKTFKHISLNQDSI